VEELREWGWLPDRLCALKDFDLLAQYDGQRLDMAPPTGEEIQLLQRHLLDQTRGIIERVKKLLEK
jgi:hypothetical protein